MEEIPKHAQESSGNAVTCAVGHRHQEFITLFLGPVEIPTHNVPGLEQNKMIRQVIGQVIQGGRMAACILSA